MDENRNLVIRYLAENVAWIRELITPEQLEDGHLTTPKKTSTSKKSKGSKKGDKVKEKPPIYWTLTDAKKSLSTTVNRIFKESKKKSLYSIDISCSG